MQKTIHLLLLVLLLGLSSSCLLANLQDTGKIVVLQLRGTGVTQEELLRFSKRFESALAPQTRYAIIGSEEAQRGLEAAHFPISEASSLHTLAEAAKILGAERVLQGSILRRGKLFNLLIRIVDASSTEAVYNKSWEHVGEFEELLSKTDAMADDITKEERGLTTGWKWYTVGAVTVVIGTVFYIIIKNIVSRDKQEVFDSGDGTTVPGPTH